MEAMELWAPDDGTHWVDMVATNVMETCWYRGDVLIHKYRWTDRGLFVEPTLIGDSDRQVTRRLWRAPPPPPPPDTWRSLLEGAADDFGDDVEPCSLAIRRAITRLDELAPGELDKEWR